jgi:uroporphyrinogen-III decarboxylase
MKTPQELLVERSNRIQAAISLQKTDRVPVVLGTDAFCAKHQNVRLSEFCKSPELACRTIINSLTSLGEFDGVEMMPTDPRLVCLMFLCDVLIPGRDLPEDSLWQIVETGYLTVDDYDRIINEGWAAVAQDVIANRMKDKNLMEECMPAIQFLPQAFKSWEEAGIVVFSPLFGGPAFDELSYGRSMGPFYRDLYKHIDKIEEVIKVRTAEWKTTIVQQMKETGQKGVFMGASRSASSFISRKFAERLLWPYLKDQVDTVVEAGGYVYLHCDSSWDRDLDLFRTLPKGRCVVSSDSSTNIYKMKEVLGDHMCLMGDVPASLLTLGTPDEVYKHCTKLVREIGPTGYILSQSCTIPQTAKPENVAAMMSAAKES